MLFGRHRLKSLVSASHNYAIAGLLLLGVALAGVALVIFDTVPDRSRRGSRRSAHCWRWPGFWFHLPLRERGSQDTAQPGL